MQNLLTSDRRTVLARIAPDLMPLADFREESLRLAQFRYSRTVMAGERANFRLIEDEPTHQDLQ